MTTQLDINLAAGLTARDKGCKTVLTDEEQFRKCVADVIEPLSREGEFTSDDVRRDMSFCDYGPPHHPNAWGAVMRAECRKLGLVILRYVPSKIKSNHAAVVGVWGMPTT